MRIAIVGAGVSGLVVAHLLHERHDVTVFEAADYAGGHTNTIRVDTPNETHQIDTGFIVFNDRNYPSFERLLARLGVAWQPSTMSFSVSDGVGDFEYSGASPNGLFANRRHLVTPWFHRMVTDLARFNRAARELLALEDSGRDLPLAEWLERQRFSRAFIDRLIVPQASAVWSADPRQMWTFPARFLVEFFDHPSCGRSGTASTRSASTTASTGRASGSKRSSPRSRTRRGASGTRTSWPAGRPSSTRRSTYRRSWGWITGTPPAPAPRASAWRYTSRAAGTASSRSTPPSRCAATSSRRARRRSSRSAIRSRTSACSR